MDQQQAAPPAAPQPALVDPAATPATASRSAAATAARPAQQQRQQGPAGTPGTVANNAPPELRPLMEIIPERNRALKEDGTLDLDATIRRMETQRSGLEKRMGVGDIRPKTVDEYTFEPTEELAPLVAALDPEATKAFQQEVFDQGFTQKQYDFVMNKYLDVLPRLAEGFRAHDMNAAIDELQQQWTTPREYNANVARANAAITGYAGADAAGIFRDYGNDPRIVRMMARIGAEMGEGSSPKGTGATSFGDISALQRSEAYSNAKHPDHARVSAQVSAHFKRLHGEG